MEDGFQNITGHTFFVVNGVLNKSYLTGFFLEGSMPCLSWYMITEAKAYHPTWLL